MKFTVEAAGFTLEQISEQVVHTLSESERAESHQFEDEVKQTDPNILAAERALEQLWEEKFSQIHGRKFWKNRITGNV
jgi:hypothetical protein